MRDPLAWTARAMEWMLMLGVMFVMTTKPPAWGCATSLVIASLTGAVAAVPIWHPSATHPATPNSPGQAQHAGIR